MSPGYLLKRIGLIVFVLWVVSTLVFGITQVLPADAATMLLGQNSTPDALAAMRDRLGLDRPVAVQYPAWLGGILAGDFGTSLRTGLPVSAMMTPALGRSLMLAVLGILLMLVIALPMRILAAVRRGRDTDVGIGLLSYVGGSLPEFVTATLLLLAFANPAVGLLPATGYVAPGEDFPGWLRHLVLPVMTVSVVLVAHVSRMVRSDLVDVLESDYVRAARLKGLRGHRVLFRHALPNALLPTITIVALDVGYRMGASSWSRRSSPSPESAASCSSPSRRAICRRSRPER